MAGNIKGITIEFDADASKLDKSLREIDKNTKTIDTELNKVNRGLKFNPTSVDLWKQKQTLLTQKIGETESKLKMLKDRQKQLDAKNIDQNSKEYRELQREIITTESKLKTFKGQLKSIGNVKLTALGAKFKEMGAKLTAVGRGMSTYITAPLAGVGVASLKAGADFDTAMSQVAATSGKTVGDIKELRDFAKEMGSTTSFSATQAAQGLNYMALAGYDAETSMKMLPTVLDLAAAGAMDLADASDMVTDAQTALGLSLDDTTILVDQMAKTSSKSNTSVSQMGEAILKIGGNAKNLSGGTRELSQVLGLLADNGIKGSEAGTHLRNIMLALNPTTEKAADAWNELGISAYDADGNLKPLEETFGELREAVKGMSSEQRTKLLTAMFNKTDLASVNALLDTSADRWSELGLAIDDASGSASKMAETQLDNMQGSLTLLKSALEGAGIAISDVLAPYVKQLADFLSGLVAKFNELDPGIQKAIVIVGALVAAIGPLLLIVGAIMSAVGMILPVLGGISAPILGIVAAIGALVAAFGTAYASSESFRKVVNEIAKSVGKQLMSVIKAAVSFFKQLFAVIKDTATEVANQLAPVLKALMPVFKWIAAFLAGRVKNAFNLIIGVIKVLGAIIKSAAVIFRGVFEALGTLAVGAYKKIKGAFSKVKDAITGPFEKAKDFIKGVIEKIKGFFPIKFGNIFSGLKLPHFSVKGGKFPFGVGGKGSLPSWDVSWYKNGGIFDKPTLLAGIGEAGPEAVVPLSGSQMQPFAKAISENMGGIDYEKLSACIVAAMMSVNTDVTIDVDGKKLANVTAPYMNTAINAIQRKQERKLGFAGV